MYCINLCKRDKQLNINCSVLHISLFFVISLLTFASVELSYTVNSYTLTNCTIEEHIIIEMHNAINNDFLYDMFLNISHTVDNHKYYAFLGFGNRERFTADTLHYLQNKYKIKDIIPCHYKTNDYEFIVHDNGHNLYTFTNWFIGFMVIIVLFTLWLWLKLINVKDNKIY